MCLIDQFYDALIYIEMTFQLISSLPGNAYIE